MFKTIFSRRREGINFTSILQFFETTFRLIPLFILMDMNNVTSGNIKNSFFSKSNKIIWNFFCVNTFMFNISASQYFCCFSKFKYITMTLKSAETRCEKWCCSRECREELSGNICRWGSFLLWIDSTYIGITGLERNFRWLTIDAKS